MIDVTAVKTKSPVLSYLKDKSIDNDYKKAYFNMTENKDIEKAIGNLKSPKDINFLCQNFFNHPQLCVDMFLGKIKYEMPGLTEKPLQTFNLKENNMDIIGAFNKEKVSGLAYSLFEFFEDKTTKNIDKIVTLINKQKEVVIQGFCKNKNVLNFQTNIGNSKNLLTRMLNAVKTKRAIFTR